MKRGIAIGTALVAAALVASGCGRPERRIPLVEYKDKVYASWLGQCVGNMFGLPHEFQYNDEPRTEPITGWHERALERIREADGAFSDDDTDIEYVDLFCMEKYGPEPTYEQLAEFWKLCINNYIWVANRSARDLMDEGYLPPLTGRRGVNPNWYQIDPQLVCEIWAVTAPGMLDYAATKADWAAKVTNDDYGTHPTIWYNTMYSAAFFETNVEKLCRIGYRHVPEGSLFREAIDDVRRWKEECGDDWVAVRKRIKEKYHDGKGLPDDVPKGGLTAILNGALGVLTLLYGQGDFEKTLHLACMAGYDADNQAATLSGLIAICHGSACIPPSYTYILDHWTEPLNDFYRNRTRDHLPDGKLTEIAERTVAVAIELIKLHGGGIERDGGEPILVIPANASFVPPLEVRLWPVHVSQLEPAEVKPLVIGGDPDRTTVVTIHEPLPAGLAVAAEGDLHPVIRGTPVEAGTWDVKVTVTQDELSRTTSLALIVERRNLASEATRVLIAVAEPTGTGSKDPDVIRDRRLRTHYDSYDGENTLEEDRFGYEWPEPISIGEIVLKYGPAFPNGGWFETVNVLHRTAGGQWQPVENLRISPDYKLDQARKGKHRYTLTFSPVETGAIVIAGKPGGDAQFTSVAELEVYEAKK